jgi:gas vesicle protein
MSSQSRKILAGALLAGLVGYIAGILTAPKSGKETRQDIKKAAAKTKTEAERQLKKLHSELSTLLDQAKSRAAEFKGRSKKDLDELVKKAKNSKQKAREVLSAFHDGEAGDPELQLAVTNAREAARNLKVYLKK